MWGNNMVRIFLILNFSVMGAFSSRAFAEQKTIEFDYLMQTWLCKKDDDSIDSCANNPNTTRKPSGIVMTNVGDGIWIGSAEIVDAVNGFNMKVNIEGVENEAANDTFELFIKFTDDVNVRPAMATMSVNGTGNWNNLFSIFNKSFKKDGVTVLPELRLMAKQMKLVNSPMQVWRLRLDLNQ
jgi:hypothetical protein